MPDLSEHCKMMSIISLSVGLPWRSDINGLADAAAAASVSKTAYRYFIGIVNRYFFGIVNLFLCF